MKQNSAYSILICGSIFSIGKTWKNRKKSDWIDQKDGMPSKMDEVLWNYLENRWEMGDVIQVSKIKSDMGKVNREQLLISYEKNDESKSIFSDGSVKQAKGSPI